MLKTIHIWIRKTHRYLVWPFSVFIGLNIIAMLIGSSNHIPKALTTGTMVLMIITGMFTHYLPKPKRTVKVTKS